MKFYLYILFLSTLLLIGSRNVFAQNNSLSFDGTDDYLSFPSTPLSAYTYELWVKFNGSVANRSIIVFTQGTAAGGGVRSRQLRTDNVGRFVHYNFDGSEKAVTSTTVAATGTWYHLAAVAQSNGTMRLFVNGIEEGTPLSVNSLENVGNNFQIGGLSPGYFSIPNLSNPAQYLNGEVDELRFWGISRFGACIPETKDCQLVGTESGLTGYFNFNQGTAAGNNTGLTTLTNSVAAGSNGTLYNFALTGASSNWVASTNGVAASCVITAPNPTTEASGLIFTNITANSFDVSWTNGNGAGRVVIVKPTTSVNVNAVADGTYYIANPDITNTLSSTVDGGKVAYIGTDNSLTVTGLNTGTTDYYVAVFEYNGCTIPNYKTGSPLTGIALSNTIWNGTVWSSGVPTASIGAIINGNYNTTTNGNIVANTLIVNSGFTINVGTGGSIGITNAIINNRNINNCSTGTVTFGSLVGNAVSVVPIVPTTESTGLSLTTTSNTITINIGTIGNGAKRMIVVKAGTAVDINAPVNNTVYVADANFAGTGTVLDGGKVVYSDTGNNVTVTGLTSGTTYHVAIFEYNDNGCGQNYKIGSPLAGNQLVFINTVWNGTAWSNGAPNSGAFNATINGNYTTATNGNIIANTLIINTGFTVNVGTGGNISTANALTNNGTINNCTTGTVTFGSLVGNAVVAAPVVPTAEATALSFATVLTNAMTINVGTIGNGANRMIVVKAGAAVDINAPVINTVYVADANFAGAGTALDGGKVVYDGTGNSVTVTGLISNTTYHIAVFEYNQNACGQTYKTGSPLAGSQITAGTTTWNGTVWDFGAPDNGTTAILAGNYSTATNGNLNVQNLTVNAAQTLTLHAAGAVNVANTLTNNGTINNCAVGTLTQGTFAGTPVFVPIAEPTTNASGVTFTAITTTSFTVNWTNGNGAKRLVVIKPASNVNGTAITDRTTYTADPNFAGGGSIVDGTGKVVYNGNVGTNVNITGLSSNTTYFIAIFEYNENVQCGANYRTSSFTSATPLTFPTAPIALAATNIAINGSGFQANWQSTSGVTDYILEVSTNVNFSTIDFTTQSSSQTVALVFGLPANSYQVFYYRVRATNAAGSSANSNVRVVITKPLPKALPPASLLATNITTQSFDLSWRAPMQGVSYYQVDIAEDANFTRMLSSFNNRQLFSTNTFVQTLKSYTAYFVRIRTVIDIPLVGIDISANSAVLRVVTLPIAPKATDATNINPNGFTANWEGVPGITSYRIDIATDERFTFIINGFNNVNITSGLRFVINSILPKSDFYYYRVRAITPDNVASISSNVIKVLPVPDAPIATTATEIKDNGFTANWREQRNTDNYMLDVSEQASFTTTLAGFKDLAIKETSRVVNQLQPGKAYFYRLRATNKSGNSSYGNTIEAITLPTVPQNLVLVSASLQQINVNWTASRSELALSYLVDISTNSTFTSNIINDRATTTPSINFTGTFEAGRQYFVRVKARHSRGGESAYSETLTITMLPAAPMNITFNQITENSFDVAWSSVTGADSYEIDIATNFNFSPITSVRRLTSNTATINATNLNSLQSYFVRVRAVNKAGISANGAFGNTITLPNPTTTVEAGNISSQEFFANWNSSMQSNIYVLEVARNESFTDMLAGFVSLEVSGSLRSLVRWQSQEKILFYRVRVVATVQGRRLVSRPSNVQRVRILAIPTGFRTSNLTQTGFTLDWGAVEGAEQYQVSVSIDNFATTLMAYNATRVNTPQIVLQRLEGNRNYQIRVKALARDGASDNGNTSQLTLPLFPEEVFLRRISSARTTVVEWQYFSLAFTRVSNLRFVVERSDVADAPYRPISSTLLLTDARSLRFDDVTGSQRLQAGYRLKISNEAGEVIFNIPNRIVTAVEDNTMEDFALLYPNPTSNSFQLKLKGNNKKVSRINIYDNAGRLVLHWENIQLLDNEIFDISKLATGKYIVEIIGDKQHAHTPLVKE